MHVINYKMSDDFKRKCLCDLLNPEYNEAGNWTMTCGICEIYDDYALVYNYEDNSYERVYYTKDDATDSIELGARKKCYVMDITEEEKNTLDTLRKLNGDTYERISDNLVNAEFNANNSAELVTKIDEMNSTIATLNMEVETSHDKFTDLESQYNLIKDEVSNLQNENASLKEYQKSVENQHKEAVITEYSDKLSEEIIDSYKAKFDQYTVEELDMHLAYELKKNGSTMFASVNTTGYLPKDTPKTGVEEILSHYKR